VVDQTEPGNDGAWEAWCDRFDRAQSDVHTMFHERHLWKNVIAMLEQSADRRDARYVNSWMIRSYVDRQCSAIRRLNDYRRDTISLRRCLRELIRRPRLLTRSRYEQLAIRTAVANGIEDDVLYERGFAGYAEFADASGDHLDRARVRGDLDTLETATASVKAYANKRIAHLDYKADLSALPLTFGDLDNAIDAVGALMRKYYGLRHPGESLAFVTPWLGEPWLIAFKHAWWTPDFRPIPEDTLG
jgi:hypothetical protein